MKVDFKILNDDQQLKLFKELPIKDQNRVINSAMRSSGNMILKAAKSNFNAVKKGKSKTNYKYIKYQVQPTKKANEFGVIIGIKNYKARWIEWGTDNRVYKIKKRNSFYKNDITTTEHKTGKIQPTHFFYNAVDSTKAQAQKNLSDAVVKSLERVVRKNNK